MHGNGKALSHQRRRRRDTVRPAESGPGTARLGLAAWPSCSVGWRCLPVYFSLPLHHYRSPSRALYVHLVDDCGEPAGGRESGSRSFLFLTQKFSVPRQGRTVQTFFFLLNREPCKLLMTGPKSFKCCPKCAYGKVYCRKVFGRVSLSTSRALGSQSDTCHGSPLGVTHFFALVPVVDVIDSNLR
jgi:hypothetical protein